MKRYMFLILLLNIFFASTFIIGKIVLEYSSPIFFIAIRMIFAGSLLLFYQLFIKKVKFNLKKSDFINLFCLSIIYIYIPFIFEFWALQYLSSAKTALLYSLTPFVTAIIAYYLVNEKISTKKRMGLMTGFLGFLPILIQQSLPEKIIGQIFFISLPEIALLISVISASYAWIYIQKKIKKEVYSFVSINGITMFLAGFFALVTSLFFENWHHAFPVNNFYYFISYTIIMIIIGNIICYNLYAFLLHKYSATFLSFTGFTIPIFTALMQWIFFKELITWQFILSSVIIFFGLYIFYQEELI